MAHPLLMPLRSFKGWQGVGGKDVHSDLILKCYVGMGRERHFESQNMLEIPKELSFRTILRQSFKVPSNFACLKSWVPKKKDISVVDKLK